MFILGVRKATQQRSHGSDFTAILFHYFGLIGPRIVCAMSRAPREELRRRIKGARDGEGGG
jgi:hypothetical protein